MAPHQYLSQQPCPEGAAKGVGFTDDLYGKEFWTRAVPSANPRLEKLITDLYEDKAGNGLM